MICRSICEYKCFAGEKGGKMESKFIIAHLQKIKLKSIKKRQMVLIGYIFFVISQNIFVSWKGELAVSFWIGLLFVLIGIKYICPIILQKVMMVKIYLKDNVLTKKEKILWSTFFFSVPFLFFSFWYRAYYPGIFSDESMLQYNQALNGIYNDWKPAIQTWFAYTIPLKISGKIEYIILFQIIEYSVVLAYMAYTFLCYIEKKAAIFSLLFITLNPLTGKIILNPCNDLTFAMSATLLMIFSFKIYVTDGEWIYKRGRIHIFIITSVLTTLFKHNAILFTLPLLVAVLICIGKKQLFLKIFIRFIVLLMIIKDPVYYTLNVIEADQVGKFQTEWLGVPMAMLGNVAKESPELLDQSTREFLFSVAPAEDWKNFYSCGDFNTIKWNENTNLSFIEETGVFKILVMTIRTLFRAPAATLKSFAYILNPVFAVDGKTYCNSNMESVLNVSGTGEEKIFDKNIIENYTNLIENSIFKYIFCYVGIINLILILSILCKYSFTDKYDRKKMMLCIPILIYNVISTLLLSGNDYKIYYLNFSLYPIAIMILFGETKYKNEFKTRTLKLHN